MIRNAVAGSRIAQWRSTQIVQEAERQQKVAREALHNVFERPAFGAKVTVTREMVVRSGGEG